MTAPQRWQPDEHMVAAVLSTPKASRKMTELSDADRAWIVAGLTLAGVTAQDIADRMSCSLRLVRSIRAEDITQMAVVAQTETRALGDDLRTERSDHALTRRELRESRTEAERLRAQVDQLLDVLRVGERIETFRTCGHPKVKWNLYRHQGRDYCRECNRERASQYRARRKTAGQNGNHTNRVTVLHAAAVASAS
ncbi:hypothetical protein [Mycobacterium dioxanotrophicus]|uniref:hypothetical protein n=1 Tax=Mycobacterium dioxanotrophicus TaxID=482462 RepID=UPI001E294BD4|nr:hypothetical protein [Mycobacterium dioxanotrophicus]